jgi:predicted ATPase/DNA-binding CsgD family transcriptional regulator
MIADQAIRRAGVPEPEIQRSLLTQRDRPRSSNLPLPLTSFVGRTQALAAIQRLLTATRLLTLTGPGGVGKTRLALEAAFALFDSFEDGVWWVDLAPLCEAGLVADTAVQALALPDDPTCSKVATLSNYLQDKNLLLVIDNCEHVIGECAVLAQQLLSACARLWILTTSRETLGVAGEAFWLVPPLSLPCLEGTPTLESLTQSEAGQLFLERARAVQPDLAVTEDVARSIAQVCCQLDGIPLAIELAAARVRVLSVPEIAAHLDDRFRLLTGGSRTALPRHQTLRAAIDWSYDLLAKPEQKLFRWLAVFAGGFTLEGARVVASDLAGPEAISAVDLVDLLSRLVTKSLLSRIEGPTTRYQMLETLRQYAWERLLAAGELERMRQRHLAYHLELARWAESGLMGEDQMEWLTLLEVEHDNLRAALAWSQESEAREAGLRLATALAGFWLRVGHLSEGIGWLERALAACREVGPVRINALYQAGRLAQHRGDYEQALVFAKQSLALSRHLKDLRGMARALGLMGWVMHWQGDRDAAGPLLEEGLALARTSDDERTIARTLLFLGDFHLRKGGHERATPFLQESLSLYQRMADEWSMAWAHCALGEAARLQGDYERAAAHLQLSLSLYQGLGSKPEIPHPMDALALIAADQEHFQRAACLWGAASAVRDSIHALLPPSYQADSAPTLEKVRTRLGEEAFAAAWTEGRALTLEQALSLAAAVPATEPASLAAPSTDVGALLQPQPGRREYGLTPREVEVLRLVASGLTDAQIAKKLVISPRTVGKHLQSIYGKLYLPSRSAATRWAIEHHLD